MIGGHAVNAYGYSRDTHDLDLLVRRSESQKWIQVLSSIGYAVYREEASFTQFTPSRSPAVWPLDLMTVNEQTFEKLFSASVSIKYRDIETRVPAVEHLIALKLHVLKQNIQRRAIKDFMDVQALIEHNGIRLNDAPIREVFEKYGTPDLYRRFEIACDQSNGN